MRNRPAVHLVYRVGVAVVGSAVVLTGIALLPLPGPGWVIIFLGLGLLATEFAWAQRLLDRTRALVRAWSAWVRARGAGVRAAVAAGALALLGGLLVGYLAWKGVPGWLPTWLPGSGWAHTRFG